MSSVQNVWRQLVQRRLWPVAVAAARRPGGGAADAGQGSRARSRPRRRRRSRPARTSSATQPIVRRRRAWTRASGARCSATRKNPFASPEAEDRPRRPTRRPTASSTGTESGGATSRVRRRRQRQRRRLRRRPAPRRRRLRPRRPSTPAPKPKTYAPHELTVRFGDGDRSSAGRSSGCSRCPRPTEPVLIYLGVLKDGKTAVFLVDDGVTPVGDGECRPSPEDCETVRLQRRRDRVLRRQRRDRHGHRRSTSSTCSRSTTARRGHQARRARAPVRSCRPARRAAARPPYRCTHASGARGTGAARRRRPSTARRP